MTHKGGHGYINHVARILKEWALHQNDLTYAYVIKGVHRTVTVSTLINEILARSWSASINFRRSARSVRKINLDTILISIDQRIYWWKISTALTSIDWLINRYTSQLVLFCDQHSSNQLFDTILTKASIKLKIFDFLFCSIVSKTHDASFVRQHVYLPACLRQSVKLCTAVEIFSLHILQPAYKFLTPRLFVSMFICLSVCVISVKFCFANFSPHILQSATNFWRLVCSSACLLVCLSASFHQSIFRLYVCSQDSEKNVLFCNFNLHILQSATNFWRLV